MAAHARQAEADHRRAYRLEKSASRTGHRLTPGLPAAAGLAPHLLSSRQARSFYHVRLPNDIMYARISTPAVLLQVRAVCYRGRSSDVTSRATFVPDPVPSEQQVKQIIAEVWSRGARDRDLSWQEIDSDFPLYTADDGAASLGLESLDIVEIGMELEEAFDVVLPTELEPAELRTVRHVVGLLERLLEEQREGA